MERRFGRTLVLGPTSQQEDPSSLFAPIHPASIVRISIRILHPPLTVPAVADELPLNSPTHPHRCQQKMQAQTHTHTHTRSHSNSMHATHTQSTCNTTKHLFAIPRVPACVHSPLDTPVGRHENKERRISWSYTRMHSPARQNANRSRIGDRAPGERGWREGS